MIRVWWCEEHLCSGEGAHSGCWKSDFITANKTDCRMVEMELHPPGTRVISGADLGTLVIERDQYGRWSIQTLSALLQAIADNKPMKEILDALAQASEAPDV